MADEKFLVLINNLLASGEIPDLFSDDEVDGIVHQVRNEAKAAGVVDTRENVWQFFIDRVRKQLKVVLCFSPVGSTLRVRAHKFPAIVTCTVHKHQLVPRLAPGGSHECFQEVLG